MKISNRDKYILITLGAILTSTLYYQFLFKPQVSKIKELKVERQEKKDKYEEVLSTIRFLDAKKSEVKELNQNIINITSNFYPKIVQENLILEIDKLLTDSNLKGTISFSSIEVGEIEVEKTEEVIELESSLQSIVDEYNNKFKSDLDSSSIESRLSDEYELNDNEAVEDNSQSQTSEFIYTAEQIKINLNFNGQYENVKKFIKNINENSRKIVINNISIAPKGQGNQVSGSMSLEFYAIPKLGDMDKEYFTWIFNNSYGKNYPFSIDGSSTENSSNNISNNSQNNKNKYDFLMTVKPISSDLPTIMLGKSNDKENESYIYSDNENIEDAEIVLTESNGKYYFKYKVGKSIYPSNYDEKGIEFTPNEQKININIISTVRLNDDDKSGVNIKIINTTNKEINVNVEGDDLDRPRVKVNII